MNDTTCIDCGHPVCCSIPHGSGHDHTAAARECSRLTRESAA